MKHPFRILFSAAPAAALLLGACQTHGGAHGMGALPMELVELYDVADPEGIIEVEAERDGSIIGLEADVPIDMLPDSVKQTVLAAAPGGRITGGEREYTSTGNGWEVKLVLDGVDWEFIVDDAGEIVETEQAIAAADAPGVVLAAADRTVPMGTRQSVELITRGDEREYHVKKLVGTASYKIVLAPDGMVIRAVREARTEIEIPLK